MKPNCAPRLAAHAIKAAVSIPYMGNEAIITVELMFTARRVSIPYMGNEEQYFVAVLIICSTFSFVNQSHRAIHSIYLVNILFNPRFKPITIIIYIKISSVD